MNENKETKVIVTCDNHKRIKTLKVARYILIGILIICAVTLLASYYSLNKESKSSITLSSQDPSQNIAENEQYNYDKDSEWEIDEQPLPSTFSVFKKESEILELDNNYSTFVINDENIEMLFRDIIKNYDENIDIKDLKSNIERSFYKDQEGLMYSYRSDQHTFKVSIIEGINQDAEIEVTIIKDIPNYLESKILIYFISIITIITIILLSYVLGYTKLLKECTNVDNENIFLKNKLAATFLRAVIISIILILVLLILSNLIAIPLAFAALLIIIEFFIQSKN